MSNNKVFLNDLPDETGSVCWSITKDSDGIGFFFSEGELKLYDCSRSVTIDFSCFYESDIDSRITKANVLLDEITKMRAALIALKIPKKRFHY
jgi:hypothetical protein